MIALVRGEVAQRRPGHVVVVTGEGTGYRVAVSDQTLAKVPAVGEQVTLHTHLIVRDDALALFGFASEQERELFLLLIGVQAVGPKVAMAVLSGGPPRELLGAIAAGDADRFQAVPGIGKRTAERIIVELRERVAAAAPEAPGGEIRVRRSGGDGDGGEEGARALAREALVGLGFGPAEAHELLESAVGESAEELIHSALAAARP